MEDKDKIYANLDYNNNMYSVCHTFDELDQSIKQLNEKFITHQKETEESLGQINNILSTQFDEQKQFNDYVYDHINQYSELYYLFIRFITSKLFIFLNSIFHWVAYQPIFNEYVYGVSRNFTIKIFIRNKNASDYYHRLKGIKELNRSLKTIIPVYVDHIGYKKGNKYFRHMSIHTFIHLCDKFKIEPDFRYI